MDLTSLVLSSGRSRALRPEELLRFLNHTVLAALDKIRAIVAKKDRSTLRLTSKALAAGLLSDRVAKDAALEGVLLPHADTLVLGFTKGLARECISVTDVDSATSSDSRALRSASAFMFVTEYI